METFSALLVICAGNSPVPGEFPTQRPVTRSFDVYFDLRPNKRLSKQSWGWWFQYLNIKRYDHLYQNTSVDFICVIQNQRRCLCCYVEEHIYADYIILVSSVVSINICQRLVDLSVRNQLFLCCVVHFVIQEVKHTKLTSRVSMTPSVYLCTIRATKVVHAY